MTAEEDLEALRVAAIQAVLAGRVDDAKKIMAVGTLEEKGASRDNE
jgi:hypothetical protein